MCLAAGLCRTAEGRREPSRPAPREERSLTANGVEGGPRALFEALSEAQAMLLAIQQRVRGPVHGPARASRPDRRSPRAAAARASGAPGTPLRSARRVAPAPTRDRKQLLSSASGWGKTLREQGQGGTSGAGEGLPGCRPKWRGRRHGDGVLPGESEFWFSRAGLTGFRSFPWRLPNPAFGVRAWLRGERGRPVTQPLAGYGLL